MTCSSSACQDMISQPLLCSFFFSFLFFHIAREMFNQLSLMWDYAMELSKHKLAQLPKLLITPLWMQKLDKRARKENTFFKKKKKKIVERHFAFCYHDMSLTKYKLLLGLHLSAEAFNRYVFDHFP